MSRRPFRIGRARTGLGLFATTEIRKRARIAQYRGPLLAHKEAVRRENAGNRYLFEINNRWTIDGTSRRNVARYANHSCNPNAEAYVVKLRVFLRAVRRIKPGEEIVYDYGRDYLKNVIGLSNCKCRRCLRRKARHKREARLRLKRREAYAKKKRAEKRAKANRKKR
ncbi:MAG: SET domain-containing protein [Pseudolabrys sp.]